MTYYDECPTCKEFWPTARAIITRDGEICHHCKAKMQLAAYENMVCGCDYGVDINDGCFHEPQCDRSAPKSDA